MSSYKVRTDLALEARENMEESAEGCRGVSVEEEYDEENEIKLTRVIIETKNGSKAMGKPIGTYITLEAPARALPDENYHEEISDELARQLRAIIPGIEKELAVMVVGLGNRDVTADALGPNVVDNLTITRHMVREYGKAAYNQSRIHMISGLIPGVMAKTGMESQEIIRGVVEMTHPDVVIIVDDYSENVELAVRNLPKVLLVPASAVNTYWMLLFKKVVITSAGLEALGQRLA